MLISLICAWGIVRGSDVVSGELSRGTMEMLLAQPVSRRQVFIQHAWMTVLFLGVLVLITWLGMSLGIWTTSVEESTYPEIRIPIVDYRIPLSFLEPQKETIAMATVVNPIKFLPGLINLFCVGVCFCGFSAFCSACDRYRWRTLGALAAFYFANAGLKIMGMGSKTFSWVEQCSLFGLYSPANAIERAEDHPFSPFWILAYADDGSLIGFGLLGDCLMLLGIGLLFYWIGLRVFIKRDLPAPM
jgi:ABC-2 type transport system permease protein